MAAHNDTPNNLDYIAPDGSYEEKVLDYLTTVSTGTDYKSEVALGNVTGKTSWNKYGFNEDVDAAAEEVIASFGGTFTPLTSAETLDVSSSSANDTSAGTGARTVLVIGIGSDGLTQQEVVTLNGVSTVTTSNTWLGVNRVAVLTAGTSGSNEGTITLNATTSATTQGEIPIGYSITQQALLHVQDNHRFLGDFFLLNVRKLSGGGGDPRVTIYGKFYSRSTGVTTTVLRLDIDTGVDNVIISTPPTPFITNAGGVLYFTADTDTNNTAVNFRFSGVEQDIS